MREWKFFASISGDDVHKTLMPASTFKKLVAYFYLKEHVFLEIDPNSELFINFCDAKWILDKADEYLLENETTFLRFCQHRCSKITKENWKEALQVAVQLDPKVKEEAIEVAVSSGVSTAEVLNMYTDLLTHVWRENKRLP
jgi:hypothetical protein